MKLLFDFFPIAFFFIGYKLYGIYVATIAIIFASILQSGIFWLKHRKIELTHGITLTMALVLGTATLIFHNEMFIKWKPTVVYWMFALFFGESQIIGIKSPLERVMSGKFVLPKTIWQRLNLTWTMFFLCMGGLNLYVVYHFNTNFWVNFKLFGILGGTLLFAILQSLYMSKYLKNSQEQSG